MSSGTSAGFSPATLHWARAMRAVTARELFKFLRQYGRLASALVRPGLWLLVFAAGFQNVLGVSIVPPYETYITYQEYMVPGLLGMVLLFNGMQSSLSMVYDREMGTMRLILTTPLPRWYLLFCKLLAGVALSLCQAYAFLLVAALFGVTVPWAGWLTMLPALVVAAAMLGAIGLLLSVYVRQLENFAGTMNFVIFPAFFFSPALYPLWKVQESGATWMVWAIRCNPFTYAVELVRFAIYAQIEPTALAVVGATGILAFAASVRGYDPQKGSLGQKRRDDV